MTSKENEPTIQTYISSMHDEIPMYFVYVHLKIADCVSVKCEQRQ